MGHTGKFDRDSRDDVGAQRLGIPQLAKGGVNVAGAPLTTPRVQFTRVPRHHWRITRKPRMAINTNNTWRVFKNILIFLWTKQPG